MRFMVMHKTNAHWESGAPPTPELIARVGQVLGEMKATGALLSAEGLRASSQGARVRLSGGKRVVVPGPFERGNELPARYAIIRAASLDEAVEWASRFAKILGDGEIDIRPVTEAWDLGMVPQPEGLTSRRYMALHKADAASEAGAPPTPEQRAAMRRLFEEMSGAGVLLAAEGFEPSAKGKRIQRSRASRTSRRKPVVLDGPFTETKELIAGFVIVQASSLDEAMRWADRYLEMVEAAEVDVRGLADIP